MTDPILSVQGLQAGYGELTVLSDVSIDVNEGDVVALVGRNGAGKTTTLRTIMGVLTPVAGTVTYADEDISDMSPIASAQRGIGFVPEGRRIFPGLTVEENLQMGRFGGSEQVGSRDIDALFDTFENLRDRRKSPGSTLSGGEQQMLAIARAIISGVDTLLLDEPTEGLAPLIVERVESLIGELNEEGMTVLLVEQNLAVARNVADRVYIIDNGETVFEGTPEELDERPDVRDAHLGVSI